MRLAQTARVEAVVKRGGRTVATLASGCTTARATSLRWDGRDAKGRKAARGSYRLQVRVLSDRKPVTRSFALRLR